ncbi:MAG TPA: ImmA/IrrE family metallo-endopeptidase, partial [Gemmatimonadales bacterium]|nr:ImmA/IrrE family metallo-endopeptidase [Gemmatimonadales bacterium]
TLDRINAEITVRAMNIAQLLRSAEVDSLYEVPEWDLDEIGTPEQAARLVREKWNVPRGPIPNFVELLERAGVVVVPCDFGAPEMDAIGMRGPDLPPMMFVNSALPVDRMRFTVAHELGHLIMHALPREDMEREADRFAAELLMPEADIKSQLRNVTLELLATLKRVWRTSMGALVRRAYTLKTISAAAYQRMMKTFSANGWRRREPAELDLSPEPPTIITQLIKFHQDDLGYEISELSSVVHLYTKHFRDWYYPAAAGLRLVG